jgi:HEAT repeat protein
MPVNRKLLRLVVSVLLCAGCEPTLPDERSALTSAMGDNDMRISTAAMRKMVQHYGGPGLREALKNPKGAIRGSAAHGLAFCAGAQNERALLDAVSDHDEYVRNWVAYSLGQIGNSNSVPTLSELSNDASPSVRDSATRAKAVLDARLHGRPAEDGDDGFASRLLAHVLGARSPVCARE